MPSAAKTVAPPAAPTSAPSRDPRVDAYIARAAPFSQPLLATLRERVHAAHPGITEAIKWGSPHFLYAGRLMAGMAAFKEHATFGFWMGDRIEGADKAGEAMGQFGRLTRAADLPAPARLKAMVRQAIDLIEAPEFLRQALIRHPEAGANFAAFPPSQQREYVEWLAEAKRVETREKRLAQALEMLAEGNRRNWKH